MVTATRFWIDSILHPGSHPRHRREEAPPTVWSAD
jgi:hypothetical protein